MVGFTKRQLKGMNEMIVKNQKAEKACSFYVSDFHLEMILVPYINQKIKDGEKVIISTEKDLRETLGILISRVTLKEEDKKKILDLNWNKSDNINVENKSNVIIIGTEKFINQKNDEIENLGQENINIINCYDFEEIKGKINNIIDEHDKSLNTIGFSSIT